MKRCSILLLALTLCAALLSGCGQPDTPSRAAEETPPALTEQQPAPEAKEPAADTPAPEAEKSPAEPAANPAAEDGAPAPPAQTDAATAAPSAPAADTVTLSISCATAVGKSDQAPEDGWILQPVEAVLADGETALSLLQAQTRAAGIPMEVSGGYVEGIANLYEFDCGDLSGWMCAVNGQFLSVGAGEYSLNAGDQVAWLYTCDLGSDLT